MPQLPGRDLLPLGQPGPCPGIRGAYPVLVGQQPQTLWWSRNTWLHAPLRPAAPTRRETKRRRMLPDPVLSPLPSFRMALEKPQMTARPLHHSIQYPPTIPGRRPRTTGRPPARFSHDVSPDLLRSGWYTQPVPWPGWAWTRDRAVGNAVHQSLAPPTPGPPGPGPPVPSATRPPPPGAAGRARAGATPRPAPGSPGGAGAAAL